MSDQTDTKSRLLDTKSASAYLGGVVAANTLRRWRSEGKGPKYVKLNHRIGYRPEDLDTWIEEKTVTTQESTQEVQ